MRYADFEVPQAVLADFVREMEDREFEGVIVGLNEEDDLLLKIAYERDQAEDINELEDELYQLLEDLPEEEEENEEGKR